MRIVIELAGSETRVISMEVLFKHLAMALKNGVVHGAVTCIVVHKDGAVDIENQPAYAPKRADKSYVARRKEIRQRGQKTLL